MRQKVGLLAVGLRAGFAWLVVIVNTEYSFRCLNATTTSSVAKQVSRPTKFELTSCYTAMYWVTEYHAPDYYA